MKKCEFLPVIDREGPEVELRNSSLFSITSGVDGGRWSMPCLCSFTCGKDTSYPYTGSWMGLRAGLDGHRKFCPCRFEPQTAQPILSRCSLYQFCYPIC